MQKKTNHFWKNTSLIGSSFFLIATKAYPGAGFAPSTPTFSPFQTKASSFTRAVSPRKTKLTSLAPQRGLLKPLASMSFAPPPPSEQAQEQSFEILDQYGSNLNLLARQGAIQPVIGREAEINRILEILLRRSKNNPVLVGEPGVGKTAVAEGLAYKITHEEVVGLTGKTIYSLDLGKLIAGTKFRGEFEERLKNILDLAKQHPNLILFIDEIHTLIGAGSSQEMDAANLLKPAMARGEIRLLGATTTDEYRKHIEQDAAFERRLQKVMIPEPSVEQTIQIVQGIKHLYEDHHGLKISDGAIVVAAKLSEQHLASRHQPDKTIDAIDEACSKLASFSGKPDDDSQNKVLEEGHVREVLSSITGVPLANLTESESEQMRHLDQQLAQTVIGQQDAIDSLTLALKRSSVGLKNPNRPIGSFLFAGPTGVGKTEVVKELARIRFGERHKFIRIDMSELMEKHDAAKLIGAPPGYVGYDERGGLVDQVKDQPYSIVLFDEVEKAHPEIFDLLLQVLDDGHLTSGAGEKISFKNTIIIMTSNLGSRAIQKGGSGFGFDLSTDPASASHERISRLVKEELSQFFRPEFLNRLDEVVVFKPLSQESVLSIAKLMLEALQKRMKSVHDIEMEFSESLLQSLIVAGYDPIYGARPMRRAIDNYLIDHLAEQILSEKICPGDKILVRKASPRSLEFDKIEL